MARDIEVILQQQKDEKANQPALSELNSPSDVAIWLNLLFNTAVAIGLHEQTFDILKAELEGLIAKAGAGTGAWLRERILEFQAGDNVVYSNGVISYPVINTAKRIITRCSVTQDGNRVVRVKVAKSDPPVALSTTEVTELDFYCKQIRFEGTEIIIVSNNADLLYIEAEVQYDGQYAAVIKGNVEAALTTYCQNLSSVANFNGIVDVNAVEETIRSAQGVKYVKLKEVSTRDAGSSWSLRGKIYELSAGTNLLFAETISGYIVPETDTGHTFSDKISYVAV